MKKGISTLLLAFLLAAGAFQVYGQQLDTVKSNNKHLSQSGRSYIVEAEKQVKSRTQQSYDDLQQANDSLQHIYDKLLHDFADQSKFIDALKKSQELWRELRKYNMNMRFPRSGDNPIRWYGSAFPPCYNAIMTSLTFNRIAFLNQWIEGIPEGDVCTGSLPFKKEE